MRMPLLLLAGAAALMLSVKVDSLLLLSIAAVCLCVYIISLQHDLALLGGVLGSSLEGLAPPLWRQPVTTSGSRGAAYADALCFRLHHLGNSLDIEARLKRVESDRPLACKNGQAENDLFIEALQYAGRHLGCAVSAILYMNTKGRPAVAIDGIANERFRLLLQRSFDECWNRQKPVWSSHCGERDWEADLTLFGLTAVICRALHWQQGVQSKKALLWLGYAGERPLHEGEKLLVREVARKIETELCASHVICELNTRVVEAESTSRQKSDFIAGVSHDIRSPLSNIKSILQLWQLEGPGEDAKELLEAALRNCENVGELLEDILDFSRFNAGKLTARREVIDLVHCLRAVVAAFRFSAEQKGLQLEWHSDVPSCFIRADGHQIKRVLANLISNGVKYTEKGVVQTRLSIESGQAVIAVKDSGSGMTEEQVARLFSPFTRFHGAEIEGVGLGLALTKILVELNHGSISLKSIPGRGSQFVVRLPALQVAEVPPPARAHRQKMRVLVVDDDADCVRTTARALRAAGFRVTEATSVTRAQELLKEDRPQILLTDAGMPDGGGEKLLHFIAGSGIGTSTIVVSGSDAEAVKARFSALGAAKFFAKPFEIDELVQAISTLPTEAAA